MPYIPPLKLKSAQPAVCRFIDIPDIGTVDLLRIVLVDHAQPDTGRYTVRMEYDMYLNLTADTMPRDSLVAAWQAALLKYD